MTTKRFTGQYHESSLPGGEGLSYYNARWYDAKLGRFLSADTIVPGSNNPQALNRYSYVFNNPLKYNDPSGHCPWCITAGIGAVIGGAVTGATYMLTTDYDNWDRGQIATVVGAGVLAGGLIGSGIGLAAGTVQMSAALAMASSAAVASGSGAIATAEAYMITNYAYGQAFDKSDFAVSTGTAAVEGAVNSLIPGSGLAVGATRAGFQPPLAPPIIWDGMPPMALVTNPRLPAPPDLAYCGEQAVRLVITPQASFNELIPCSCARRSPARTGRQRSG